MSGGRQIRSITELVSSDLGENGRRSTKSPQNSSRAAENATVDIENDLQIHETGRN